ncbi:transcriptional regulator GlxA family with amidase domain [Pseudomonas fluorescens]|uniref:hypothetical protein n=1 Tax=Pseudomonas fluorescens TaxID=294 RepID=UPI0020A04443|nr:hypothetical protein [Pseudomonas fluorescens]MCP1488242.1 transcriptional regulator GlxA family with amidase domain [Pseudomonas fluorescens]
MSLHAKHPSFAATADTRTVVVLAFDDLLLLNAAGPLEVFAAIARVLGEPYSASPPYRLLIASPRGGQVMSISGISVTTCSLEQIDDIAPLIDTLIVAGGPGMAALEADEEACAWLRRRSVDIRRLCSRVPLPWPQPACSMVGK